MSFRKRTFKWILLVRLLMWSAIAYGCDLSAEKKFGSKTFCSSSNSMNFNNAITTCSSGYVLASIENFVDYTDTMRAIQHFFEDEERVYVSLQNPNRQTCESDEQDTCNNRLKDANGNNLPSLDHVADLNGEDRMCMLYDTDAEYFRGADCSSEAKVLCQKYVGPSDCGSDQSYYNLEVFAQHPQARSKCQALGLNLATPLSMQDLDKLDDINYDG
ncbi:uncharacterized protein LOC131885532 [Tigriopus californicus]|uniref:uncharacterized protein LOC131885532 n=1 Tax=Tigriopus californicus TaxID=6832 RepID=UPI0027DA159E|nr:uncharacterized protein LOC131885532 [Tigriopus californicus]